MHFGGAVGQSFSLGTVARWAALASALALTAACTETKNGPVHIKGDQNAQIPSRLKAEMAKQGMPLGSPVLARVFKEENKVELWKQKSNGRYGLLASYEICKYSGKLGPKYTEGDRQAPEGFYNVGPASMNPNSKFHLSFDIGFPNKFDRVNKRTGANLMVHGACSSSGCYSMEDGPMTEIYAVAREAFKGGQRSFQIQAYPFRMTAQNMARYRNDVNHEFWTNLKEGYDAFEVTKTPPSVDVCEKRYVFNRDAGTGNGSQACPATPKVADAALQSYMNSYNASYSAASSAANLPPPKASIQGLKEANMVKDWAKRRERGERISIDPPSLNPDGTVSVTARMGRATNEAGRRMAAQEAEETRRKQEAAAEAEAKRLKEEAKAQAAGKAAKKAAEAGGEIKVVQPAEAAPAPAPEAGQDDGLLRKARNRIGSLLGG